MSRLYCVVSVFGLRALLLARITHLLAHDCKSIDGGVFGQIRFWFMRKNPRNVSHNRHVNALPKHRLNINTSITKLVLVFSQIGSTFIFLHFHFHLQSNALFLCLCLAVPSVDSFSVVCFWHQPNTVNGCDYILVCRFANANDNCSR